MARRHAFRMQLKPGARELYRERHDAIWPELVELLHSSGISNYSIYLDEPTNLLFGVLILADNDHLDALPDHPVMRRWWAWMAPLMETHADNRPVEQPLVTMFEMA